MSTAAISETLLERLPDAWSQRIIKSSAAVADLMAQVGDGPDDLESCAALLQTLRTYRGVLSAYIEQVEQQTAALCPHGGATVEGVGTVSVHRRSTRARYDGALLLSALAARVADEVVDRTTGEIPPVGVITERAVMATAEAAGAMAPSFAGWRKGVVSRHGLDLQQYEIEREYGGLTVRIT